MHTPYYILALLYATLLYADFIICHFIICHFIICRLFASMAPYALKGQKLLAQGNTLGINGHKPVAL